MRCSASSKSGARGPTSRSLQFGGAPFAQQSAICGKIDLIDFARRGDPYRVTADEFPSCASAGGAGGWGVGGAAAASAADQTSSDARNIAAIRHQSRPRPAARSHCPRIRASIARSRSHPSRSWRSPRRGRSRRLDVARLMRRAQPGLARSFGNRLVWVDGTG